MKSILDPSFEYTPSYATDIQKTFARVWRELSEREEAGIVVRDGGAVWLECNGELVASSAVSVVGKRVSALGIEMVQFVCPSCRQRHESLIFA